MERSLSWSCLALALTLSACGGGGGGGEGDGDGASPGTPAPATASTLVLAANDLGMHCIDKEYSVFSILPPFNVVNAQVIGHGGDGKPVLLDQSRVDVRYSAATDARGSINSYSRAKTDFWSHANSLFGANLADGQGLTGLFMPGDDPQNRGPQPMTFNAARAAFQAEGIPITSTDDGNATNPYPLLKISAHDKQSGQQLGSLNIVVPVATETDCRGCHVTGGTASTRTGINWANDADAEVQSKKNILKLHDALHSTSLMSATPVLCASCHYSAALDLSGAGPSGNQSGRQTMSKVMHSFHGSLTSNGQPVFPANISSCYQCHPGQITKCERGAMKNAGIDCTGCHGGMQAVGGDHTLLAGGSIDGANDGNARRPWKDLPRCQSCHTGDAVNHLSGADLVTDDANGIRLRQAYRSGDAAASPLLANNKRFAEETGKLYRFSKGHGGVTCEGCHGSTHAEWPNADDAANDNVPAKAMQGYVGKLMECTVCHTQGSLPATTNGPHGLHNVNSAAWLDERHGDFYERDKAGCKACHGTDLRGSPLSEVPVARTFRVEGKTVTFAKGDAVGCGHCHSRPGL